MPDTNEKKESIIAQPKYQTIEIPNRKSQLLLQTAIDRDSYQRQNNGSVSQKTRRNQTHDIDRVRVVQVSLDVPLRVHARLSGVLETIATTSHNSC